MAETDIVGLREALQAQQQLLHNLYRELDAEREAAATAANETMSMILRLQGEKSVLKMEANQYKRMAEEKMCHAEEALALCEDLMLQKEMEIASLQFQLQSCRNRLLGNGVGDEPITLMSQKSDMMFVEKVVHGKVRRLNSLPPWRVGFDKEQCAPPTVIAIDEGAELTSELEKIRRLDEQVKEISGGSKDQDEHKATVWRGGTWSPSLYSQIGEGNGTGSDRFKTMLRSSSNEKKAPKDAPVDDHQDHHVSVGDYEKLVRRIERLERESSIGGRQQQEIVSCGRSTAEEEGIHLLKAIQEQLSGIQSELRSRKAERIPPDDEPCLDVLQEAMVYFWF